MTSIETDNNSNLEPLDELFPNLRGNAGSNTNHGDTIPNGKDNNDNLFIKDTRAPSDCVDLTHGMISGEIEIKPWLSRKYNKTKKKKEVLEWKSPKK